MDSNQVDDIIHLMVEAPRAVPFEPQPILQKEQLDPISVETVHVIGNRGPCGGVNMAIETMDMVLRMVNGREPVYITNELVHYPEVMDEFYERGLVLVGSVDEIPAKAISPWSAHGHTPEDDKKAQEKGLITIDTTCQLVTKVQKAAKRAVGRGEEVVYLGSKKKGKIHPETRSVLGHTEEEIRRLQDTEKDKVGSIHLAQTPEEAEEIVLQPGQRALLLSQTTMSKKETRATRDKLSEQLGDSLNTSVEAGICLATDNRQTALERYGERDDIDAFIVVGDISISHNTKELFKLGESLKPTLALTSELELDGLSFTANGPRTIALTSGASVPDSAAPHRILNWFQQRGATIVYDEPLIDERTASFQKPVGDLLRLAQALEKRYGDSIPKNIIEMAQRKKLL